MVYLGYLLFSSLQRDILLIFGILIKYINVFLF